MSDILQGLPAASVAATGGNLDGLAATVFTWSDLQARSWVQSLPTYTGLLYVKLNATTAAENDWDFVIQPGVPMILDLPRVRNLAIFGTVAATYGTDFVVKGMN